LGNENPEERKYKKSRKQRYKTSHGSLMLTLSIKGELGRGTMQIKFLQKD
jgi:hypothetical protein